MEFTTHGEASRAMEALKHTHLLGRHLVLQWAKEDEGVDVSKLRERVGNDWRRGAVDSTRLGKRKLDLSGDTGDDDGLEV